MVFILQEYDLIAKKAGLNVTTCNYFDLHNLCE